MRCEYAVLAGLCLLGLGIRTGYELLKDSGRIDPRNKAVFAIVFAGMGAVLASWPFLCPLDPLRVVLPGALRWMGMLILVAGLGLALGGLNRLKGLENIDHLVTDGIFAKLRHPMYTGFLLWILGWVLYYGALLSLMIGLVSAAGILYWRRLEELRLEAQFGDDYRSYRKSTWF